jgi:hypothetical protein
MGSSTPAQRSVHSMAGHTVRADCEGGALASDCGVLLRRGIARQSGRPARLAAAIHATRHPADVAHPRRALLAPRLSPMAAGAIPCVSWGARVRPWRPRRTWRGRPPARGWPIGWRVRTSRGAPRRGGPPAAPALQSRRRPSCSPSRLPTIRPTASRRGRSTIIIRSTLALCLS